MVESTKRKDKYLNPVMCEVKAVLFLCGTLCVCVSGCSSGEVKIWKSPQYSAMTMSTGRVFELSL
jgi:hypothetical protein